jgi:hypothetical protein
VDEHGLDRLPRAYGRALVNAREQDSHRQTALFRLERKVEAVRRHAAASEFFDLGLKVFGIRDSCDAGEEVAPDDFRFGADGQPPLSDL